MAQYISSRSIRKRKQIGVVSQDPMGKGRPYEQPAREDLTYRGTTINLKAGFSTTKIEARC